jgi:hypothetical protein
MQATTVISLLTVGVSVASVIVNLYIARASRKTSLEVLQFKATLDRADASVKLIKELEMEGEKLRIRGHQLVTQIGQVQQRLKTSARSESAVKAVIEAGEALSQQSSIFLDKWATVKSELSAEQYELLGALRHQCRGLIDNGAVHLITLSTVSRSPEKAIEVLIHLESHTRELLSSMQQFILNASAVRRSILLSPHFMHPK